MGRCGSFVDVELRRLSVSITFRGAWSGTACARRAQTLRVESGDRRGNGKHYAVRATCPRPAPRVSISPVSTPTGSRNYVPPYICTPFSTLFLNTACFIISFLAPIAACVLWLCVFASSGLSKSSHTRVFISLYCPLRLSL